MLRPKIFCDGLRHDMKIKYFRFGTKESYLNVIYFENIIRAYSQKLLYYQSQTLIGKSWDAA